MSLAESGLPPAHWHELVALEKSRVASIAALECRAASDVDATRAAIVVLDRARSRELSELMRTLDSLGDSGIYLTPSGLGRLGGVLG